MLRRVFRPAAGLAWIMVVGLPACGDKPIVMDMGRTVDPVEDPAKGVSVAAPLELCDSPVKLRCMVLPPGSYILEAQDSSFWYFRAPAPIGFRQVTPEETREQKIAGGLMIGRSSWSASPAAAYIEGSKPTAKAMVWRLDEDFMKREGTDWKKTF